MHPIRAIVSWRKPERCVARFSCHILSQAIIRGEAVMDFRGIHFCWFPETPYFEMEELLVLAAFSNSIMR